MSTRCIALIDIDGVLYARASSAEAFLGNDGDSPQFLQLETPEKTMARVEERIEEILLKTGADDAILCLSSSRNFRYDVLPSYKSNRHGLRRPQSLTRLKEILKDRKPWPVLEIEGLEADDVCGISAGSLKNTIVCSPDKDLKTVPGRYYACRSDSVVQEISEAEADYTHLFQTLVGDTVDGYAGCPKVGKVKAAKLLEPFWFPSESDGNLFETAKAWQAVVAAFEKAGLTAEDALTQARVARILRASDWDSTTREVILWEPPTVVTGQDLQPA